jgi:glutamate/tyrosine decarboxylase-like PLP-dependent enzyme
MTNLRAPLLVAFDEAVRYRENLGESGYQPRRSYNEMREAFREPTPEEPKDGVAVIRELARRAEPGLMAMAGPRFFGWVLGGSHPVGVAADWMTSAWGQNAGSHSATPSAAATEEVAASWLLDILDLPREASVGFTTGATVGNFVGLSAARSAVLRKVGWDPDSNGLFGAPEVHVFVGDEAHTSVFSALQYCGLGRDRVIRIPTDDHGRMLVPALRSEESSRNGPKIIVAQAGQINTGAFDPFSDIVAIARASGAWVHVDCAFGLWARAAPSKHYLTKGLEKADSWVTDGHKWLQLPFDSGFVFVRDVDAHRRAMTTAASYLPGHAEGDRIPSHLVPELSRRARGFAAWAMIKTLGRHGISQMIERHCWIARQMAERLATEPGVRVANKVDLNQFVVEFGPPDAPVDERDRLTQAVIDRIQSEDKCLVAGAHWKGRWVMRVSVISAATDEEAGEQSATAIISAWRNVRDRKA